MNLKFLIKTFSFGIGTTRTFLNSQSANLDRIRLVMMMVVRSIWYNEKANILGLIQGISPNILLTDSKNRNRNQNSLRRY